MKKVALIILDGWGHGEPQDNNAIYKARTPFFDKLWSKYPHTLLQASGTHVGLPEGQIGGSEVGHLTIGAGKVVYQQLPRITKILNNDDHDESLSTNNNFQKFLNDAQNHTPHLIGLVSDGGVHSHLNHLFRLLDILKEYRCKAPKIHIITDGRDTPPQSATTYIARLVQKLHELQYGEIATISGRFYAMDRDNNHDRMERTIDVLIGKGQPYTEPIVDVIQKSYDNGVNDEFIVPLQQAEYMGIDRSEPVLFWNFRADRMRQLTRALQQRLPHNLLVTFTKYHTDDPLPFLFTPQRVGTTLGEHLENLGKTQLLAAETEKFPHVTYFFNGGVEVVRNGEKRHMSQSNKVKHDEIPEMKVADIVQNVNTIVRGEQPDFILVNFANPDMVGHTGNFDAVVKAVETVDTELKKITETLLQYNYICCITADHGNADFMYEPDGTPHTAHTLARVPFILYGKEVHNIQLKHGEHLGLSDIAGTVLELMGLPKPKDGYESLMRP